MQGAVFQIVFLLHDITSQVTFALFGIGFQSTNFKQSKNHNPQSKPQLI